MKYKSIVPICDFCKGKDACEEPGKEKRVSCPDELYMRYNKDEEQEKRNEV